MFPIMVALYTIGSTRSWEGTVAAAAAPPAAGLIYMLVGGTEFDDDDLIRRPPTCAVSGGLGLFVRAGATASSARKRAERLDRERELLAERAVAEERLRIAQELHDVVAHNVSLIVVQAQALGATVPDERVAEATDEIADLGREAMAEMHRTLKLLRGGEDQTAERAPQPGLADLDDLLEHSRAAGVRVELAVEGDRARSPRASTSAFRIVQEALTNVVKHAGRAHATVMLGYRADALELTITDTGDGAAAPAGRAATASSACASGPPVRRHPHRRPARRRGFEVRASLPYDGAPHEPRCGS